MKTQKMQEFLNSNCSENQFVLESSDHTLAMCQIALACGIPAEDCLKAVKSFLKNESGSVEEYMRELAKLNS